MTDTRLLQQVLLHVSSLYNTLFIKEDLHIFPKSAGVIIANGFGIPKGCKIWISEMAFYGQDWNKNKHVQWLPSRTGLACMICCSIQECCPLTAARNWRISLVLSVFPAPDSPLTQTNQKNVLSIHCLLGFLRPYWQQYLLKLININVLKSIETELQCY